MQNIEGLYSALAAIIKTKEDDGHVAIDKKSLIESVKNEVDVYSASMDWYVKTVLNAAAEVALYQAGYKSVIKGDGLFVNVENCMDKNILARLFNNAKLSALQKQQATALIMKQIQKAGLSGQLSIDFESGTIVEDITEQELLAILLADAKEA